MKVTSNPVKGSQGTDDTKFIPTLGIEDEFVYYQTITMMKDYNNKSIEELRLEDYKAGHSVQRKRKRWNSNKGRVPLFYPVCDTETVTTHGQTTTLSVRYQCIVVNKNYSNKSLEELRLEHYEQNTGKGRPSLFEPVCDTERVIRYGEKCHVPVTYHSITVNEFYKNMSFEEIRLQDYNYSGNDLHCNNLPEPEQHSDKDNKGIDITEAKLPDDQNTANTSDVTVKIENIFDNKSKKVSIDAATTECVKESTETEITPQAYPTNTKSGNKSFCSAEVANKPIFGISTAVPAEMANKEIFGIPTGVPNETANKEMFGISTAVPAETANKEIFGIPTGVPDETANKEIFGISTAVLAETANKPIFGIPTGVPDETANKEIFGISTAVPAETANKPIFGIPFTASTSETVKSVSNKQISDINLNVNTKILGIPVPETNEKPLLSTSSEYKSLFAAKSENQPRFSSSTPNLTNKPFDIVTSGTKNEPAFSKKIDKTIEPVLESTSTKQISETKSIFSTETSSKQFVDARDAKIQLFEESKKIFKAHDANKPLFGGHKIKKPLFGAQGAKTTLFGAADANKPLFGGQYTIKPIFGVNDANKSIFGTPESKIPIFEVNDANKSLFGTPETKKPIFEVNDANKSLFGTKDTKKPIFRVNDANKSLFGSKDTTKPIFGVNDANKSLFGTQDTTKPIFGVNDANKSLFGTKDTKKPIFGVNDANKSIFGTQDTTKPIFGVNDANKSLFGTQDTTKPIFGVNDANKSLFGTKDTKKPIFGVNDANKSIFGTKDTKKPIFGVNDANKSLFGTQDTTKPIFGVNDANKSLFGTKDTKKPIFGVNDANKSIFGTKDTKKPIFGVNDANKSIFGTKDTTKPIFGVNDANKPLFGTQDTKNLIFGGNDANKPLFGIPTPQNANKPLLGIATSSTESEPTFGFNKQNSDEKTNLHQNTINTKDKFIICNDQRNRIEADSDLTDTRSIPQSSQTASEVINVVQSEETANLETRALSLLDKPIFTEISNIAAQCSLSDNDNDKHNSLEIFERPDTCSTPQLGFQSGNESASTSACNNVLANKQVRGDKLIRHKSKSKMNNEPFFFKSPNITTSSSPLKFKFVTTSMPIPFDITGNRFTNAEVLVNESEDPPEVLPLTTTTASCSTSLLGHESKNGINFKSPNVEATRSGLSKLKINNEDLSASLQTSTTATSGAISVDNSNLFKTSNPISFGNKDTLSTLMKSSSDSAKKSVSRITCNTPANSISFFSRPDKPSGLIDFQNCLESNANVASSSAHVNLNKPSSSSTQPGLAESDGPSSFISTIPMSTTELSTDGSPRAIAKPSAEHPFITSVVVMKESKETFGLKLKQIDGSIVSKVRFGTPAYKAGLRDGDELLSVNTEPICGLTVKEVISIIRHDDTYVVFGVKKAEQLGGPPAHHSTTSYRKVANNANINQMLSLCSEVGDPKHQKHTLTDLSLHTTVGRNIHRLILNRCVCIAYRHQYPFYQGYTFSANPLISGQAIVLQIISTIPCRGSLAIGFTACDPATLTQSDLPDDVTELLDRPEYWVVRTDSGTSLERGDELTMLIMKNGEVTLSRNGSEPSTVMHIDNTLKLWALFAIRGSTECVRFYSMMIPESELLPQSNENSSKSSSKNKGSESRESECAICLEMPINSVLYTCGHMSMCYECAIEVRSRGDGRCPLCRAYIADVIRTYKA